MTFDVYQISFSKLTTLYSNYFIAGIAMYWIEGQGWIKNELPCENEFHVKQLVAEFASRGATKLNFYLIHKKHQNMKVYPDFALSELTGVDIPHILDAALYLMQNSELTTR